MTAHGWRKRQIMQWIPNNSIKWDGPCYKCKSYFCDRTCEEDASNVVSGSSDLENKRRDEAFADFIGGVAYEEDRGWSKEVWDAAWSARREWVGLTDEQGGLDRHQFAGLIVRKCADLLWNESERLYAYSSECNEVRDSHEAEIAAEKCLDNIKMLKEHFGVNDASSTTDT